MQFYNLCINYYYYLIFILLLSNIYIIIVIIPFTVTLYNVTSQKLYFNKNNT